MKDLDHYTFNEAKQMFSMAEKIEIFYDLFEAQREISKKIEELRPSLESSLLSFTSKKSFFRETGDLVDKDFYLKEVLNVSISRDNFTRNVRTKKYSVETMSKYFELIKRDTYQNENTNNL